MKRFLLYFKHFFLTNTGKILKKFSRFPVKLTTNYATRYTNVDLDFKNFSEMNKEILKPRCLNKFPKNISKGVRSFEELNFKL